MLDEVQSRFQGNPMDRDLIREEREKGRKWETWVILFVWRNPLQDKIQGLLAKGKGSMHKILFQEIE